jgi:hypothetical protein
VLRTKRIQQRADIRSGTVAARKEAADTATAKLEELQEQLRLTTLATEITVDREQGEPYYRMRDDFAVLSECQKIWNVLTEKAIDRIVERSTSSKVITRNPVSFSLDSCDLIQWEQKIPHLQNCTGGDMYIYPGFILYRASKQAFALMEFRVVTLEFVPTHFTEAETIPTDTQVTGQTWALSNKDGSPDRRFRDNYQIPVVHYGFLLFKSRDGLDVRYMCSNARAAEQFAKSWTTFRMSFSTDFHPQGNDANAAGGPPKPIEVWRQAAEALKAVFDTFRVAQDRFLAPIRSAVNEKDPTCKKTMDKADVTAYVRALRNVIVAEKHLEESATFVPRSARTKVRRVLQDIEARCTSFETSVSGGRITNETLWPFTTAVDAFMDAQSDFLDAATAAMEKGRGRR